MSDAPAPPAAWPPHWPRALDADFGPPASGDYRVTPEDFIVEERLGFEPEGEGEHLWLWVEKRDLSTIELARRLATACEVTPRDIGFSGMKDRYAIARQWLSVHLPGREAPADLEARLAETPVRLIEQRRHPRKLKRGVHRANRFELRLTGEAIDDARFEARWQRLVDAGVANYFGPQRFGPGGRNLAKARAVLARGWRKRDDRDGMLLSSARSYLFNQLLARRVAEGSWSGVLEGELAILDGTASQFRVEALDDSLRERAAILDVHASGVLWGVGELASRGIAAEHERVVAQQEASLAAGLERAGVRMGRRALRIRLSEPSLLRRDAAVHVSFELPRGAFATAVLRELMSHSTL
ncbi:MULTISPECIES: tRNA pseudouridine(13) synthase TruD [Halomonadaceae]|uniref:tRNA pseudouridine(13) synthase TruD n=1 Tax=Halomonadaceae TaxID=28256 RepID=UPI001599105C|nr:MULTISPECIES: tRNA pseudouridine(13) synthase TruD [Halomonas]QJQ96074.1 tRNA pseudouridine(13) synthase TruD [Halomonas sp. PA5]